jgi:hypothetical protein
MGAFSLGLSAKLVMRFGFRSPLATGLLLAANSHVQKSDSALASGVVNTAFMMGGALGLAVLASLAASRTDSLRASGHAPLDALNGGYHAALLVGALFALAAAAIGAALLRPNPAGAQAEGAPEVIAEAA